MNKSILKPIVMIAALLCTGAAQAQSSASSSRPGIVRGMLGGTVNTLGLRGPAFNNRFDANARAQGNSDRPRGLNVAVGNLRVAVALDRANGGRGFNRLGGSSALPGLAGAERRADRRAERAERFGTRPLGQMLVGMSERDSRDERSNDDSDDNGFLGVENSSTLGTDERDGSGRDDGDSGFLGIGNSSTLGTDDNDGSGRDDGDNGFLGINNSSTLGTDGPDGSRDSGFLGIGNSSTLGTD
ncbi:MAG: hypothetical protein ACT4QA_11155 [Panacagrimonas sp.]